MRSFLAISFFRHALMIFFWSDPFSSFFFVLYTMALLSFLSPTCGLGVQSSFSPSLLPSLESSILSWNAACPLFRYHLHINAARRLVGRHLMRRWQYLKIFVISYYYPLFYISPFTLLQDSSHALLWVINEFIRYLGQKFRGDHRPRTWPIPHKHASPLLGG